MAITASIPKDQQKSQQCRCFVQYSFIPIAQIALVDEAAFYSGRFIKHLGPPVYIVYLLKIHRINNILYSVVLS